jgi:membrane-bound ClpP family serine protease
MTPFILVAIGLLLIYAEFYLPGAVMAVIGSIFIFVGIFLFASETTSGLALLLFVFGIAVAVALVIRLALWRIVHSKSKFSIYSDKSQEGYQASMYDSSAIGKEGRVIADLKPGGFIVIADEQHAAISISGYISKGENVIVIGGQEQSLIVKKK